VVSWYEFALFVHIFAAVVWAGGSLTAQALAFRIVRTNDPRRMAGFAKDIERIGMALYFPASVLLLAFGFVLVHEGGWGYPFWVVFGLVVLGLSAVAGMAFFGPESARIGRLIEQHGPDYPEVQSRIRRILALTRIELVLLIAVVFAWSSSRSTEPRMAFLAAAVTQRS
jgi:uncharacterized membrane protein